MAIIPAPLAHGPGIDGRHESKMKVECIVEMCAYRGGWGFDLTGLALGSTVGFESEKIREQRWPMLIPKEIRVSVAVPGLALKNRG